MEPLILTIDCGTQSMRAMLFNKSGDMEAIEKVSFEPYFSVSPGFAEQDADVYYNALCTAVKGLKEKSGEKFSQVAAVTVATQRDTIVLLDSAYKPVRPCILWLDQRVADVKLEDYFTPGEIAAYTLVGMKKTSEYVMRRSRTYWVQQNEPEVWAKTDKAVMLSCYLNYRLTGKLRDTYAAQIGHVPFSVKANDWYKSAKNIKYRQFGLTKEQMPELVRPGGQLGSVTNEAAGETGIPAGLPVIATASDKGCETLGNGCLYEDEASVSFGTTATVEITTDKYIETLRFIPPYPSAVEGFYNPEYEVFRGYWLISWFKREFAAHEVAEAKRTGESVETLLNRRLGSVPVGSNGLMLQPYWKPELKMEDGRGAIIGFNAVHTRIHIYRAIIEGINYAIMNGIERMEKCTKTRIKRVVAAGGGSQSSEICQITADMLGVPVSRVQTHETTGLGAAILGFYGLNEYKSVREAVEHMVRVKDTFTPDLKNSGIYRRLYNEVYKCMYPALKSLYKTGNRILEEQQ
ncbi:MAG TPA: FGGY-family carbohydrate kinase [Clostridia bacterium]|nr:FGGY-family carbohydrate kinase [Clostridia bacterium]